MRNLFLISIFAFGCSHTPNQPTSPGTNYKYSAEIKINGKNCKGFCVAEKSDDYEIKVSSNGRMDSLTLRTCSREIPISDVGSSEWIDFTPDLVFEGVGGYCPIYITGLEKKKERHTFGMIVFQHENYQLSARIVCNGRVNIKKGAWYCEHREGMPAAIEFDEPVISESACFESSLMEIVKSYKIGEGKRIIFEVPSGECVHYFGNSKGKFKFITYGYSEFINEGL